MKNKIKKVTIEMIIYGVVVVFSSALFHMNQSVKPTTYHAKGKVQFALISVPVPVDPNMEGHEFDYMVRCGMKKGVIECQAE